MGPAVYMWRSIRELVLGATRTKEELKAVWTMILADMTSSSNTEEGSSIMSSGIVLTLSIATGWILVDDNVTEAEGEVELKAA